MGCDYAQGFLFSRPVAAKDFEQYMAAYVAIPAAAIMSGS
jgi:EAL domain-containing protein (putative c-di-GMP-specific phosphodiesterase class I)